jgi:dolichol-phosphate mannosyltransferase
VRLSIVAPCFNEERVLPELHRRVSAAASSTVGDSHEILLVNDGSKDHTWDAICELAIRDPHVVGVDLSRNFGHQLAISAGLELARGELVFVLDADLQDPPELLGDMLKLIEQGADVVYGQRRDRKGETWFKRVTAAAFYRLLGRVTDLDIPYDTGDFRLMRRQVVSVLRGMPECHRFVRGMVAWIGFHQVPLSYDRAPRVGGTTKYTLGKMLRFALDALTGFSIVPLKLASVCGFAFGLVAVLMIVYTLFAWAMGRTVPGWSSLMVLISVLGSAQLLAIGIMGEYLGRLYMQAKQRPNFVIREVRGSFVASGSVESTTGV